VQGLSVDADQRRLLVRAAMVRSVGSCFSRSYLEEEIMDKDRIAGSAKQVKGAVKEVVGKAVGDTKLESEGKADKIEGKVQNAIGGLKDTLKGK
jgi:uncharacterized protein YjbJ (UPF0337 family)